MGRNVTNRYLQSNAIWDLVLKYSNAMLDPCLTYKEKQEFEKEIAANGYEVQSFNDIRIKKVLPDIIRDNNFFYFVRRNPDKFFEWIKNTLILNLRGVLRHSIPNKFWSIKNGNFSQEYLFKILKLIISKT